MKTMTTRVQIAVVPEPDDRRALHAVQGPLRLPRAGRARHGVRRGPLHLLHASQQRRHPRTSNSIFFFVLLINIRNDLSDIALFIAIDSHTFVYKYAISLGLIVFCCCFLPIPHQRSLDTETSLHLAQSFSDCACPILF